MSEAIAVLTTTASRADAERLAEALVGRRLAACAQISAIYSVYRWEGELRREPEYRLLLKTTRARYDALEQAIRELHGYALPAIYALAAEPIEAGYAAWLREETSEAR